MNNQKKLTATFVQCTTLLGVEISEIKKENVDEIMSKVNSLTQYDEDEKFEIFEQLKHVTESGTAAWAHDGDVDTVETDDISGSMCPEPSTTLFCGKGRVSTHIPKNLHFNQPKIAQKDTKLAPQRLEFPEILVKFSPSARKLLTLENCTTPEVFARLTNGEIETFGLGAADMKLMRCLVLQCRAKSLKAQQAKAKCEMPDNPITRALPIKSKVTIRALKKAGLLSPVNLYLFTDMETILALFEKYPSISESDKQNILMGMAMAKLASRTKKV